MTQRLILRHGDCVEVLKGYEDGFDKGYIKGYSRAKR